MRLGVLCVLESGTLFSLKIPSDGILAVLAFGAVRLRLLDIGVPPAPGVEGRSVEKWSLSRGHTPP